MILDYIEWRKFKGVIVKAQEACDLSSNQINYHFVGSDKMIGIC